MAPSRSTNGEAKEREIERKKLDELRAESFIHMKIEPTAQKQTVNKIPIFQSRIIFIAAYFLSAHIYIVFFFSLSLSVFSVLFLFVGCSFSWFVCLFDFAVWFSISSFWVVCVAGRCVIFFFSLLSCCFCMASRRKICVFHQFSCDATVFFFFFFFSCVPFGIIVAHERIVNTRK